MYIIGGDGTQKGAYEIYKVLHMLFRTSYVVKLHVNFCTIGPSMLKHVKNLNPEVISYYVLFLQLLQEIRRRGLQVAVAGIPKTIDNDIAVIFFLCFQRSFCCPRLDLKDCSEETWINADCLYTPLVRL